jgi:hypothetical protein
MAHYPKPNTKPNPKPGPKANPTPNPKQVSAISSSKLPAWKRPVMNADVARIYNEHAAPIFRKARPARPHARPHARPACPRLPGHTSGRAEDTRRRCPPRKPAESQPHPHRASPPPPRSWASRWWTPTRAASATPSSPRTACTSQARRVRTLHTCAHDARPAARRAVCTLRMRYTYRARPLSRRALAAARAGVPAHRVRPTNEQPAR